MMRHTTKRLHLTSNAQAAGRPRRGFWLSLRTRLMTVFLVVTTVAVGAVALFGNRTTSNLLTANVGAGLKNLASVQAGAIGNLLAQQVGALQTLSLAKALQEELDIRSQGYTGAPSAILEQLLRQDETWKKAKTSDALIQTRIDPLVNTVASELQEFRATFPDHVEVFVTDRYGGVVAATGRTSDYYQADEEWWLAAFADGRGAPYISQPTYDASSAYFALDIAVPVYSHVTSPQGGLGTQKLVGILRTTYRLDPLFDLLAQAHVGQAGRVDLFSGNQENWALIDNKLVQPDPAIKKLVEATAGQEYAMGDYQNTPSLLSQAPVAISSSNLAVTPLDWTVVVHQQQDEALAPVGLQARNTFILALAILAITAAVALGVAHVLANPIIRLTAVARQIAGGDLTARVSAAQVSNDETGILATTFNTMADRLRGTIDTLEERVAERTRQIQTVVQVSQQLAGILDLSDLLRQVVTTTKETFNYYHVHIYLLDEQSRRLNLAEGYGEAGAEMKRRGHDISLLAPKSLVARAARDGRIVTVVDVQLEPGWLPNPLLPETRSEMAVPVRLGAEVVGVLDVQSERVGGLTVDDESTMQILANQVAVAVRNARMFSQTQDALYQAQKLQRLYTGQAWEKLTASRPTTHYECRRAALAPLNGAEPAEARAALEQGRTVDLKPAVPPAAEPRPEAGEGPRPEAQKGVAAAETSLVPAPAGIQSAVATPLKLRGEIIGVLGLQAEDPQRQWSADEIALIEAVGEQMSLAIENARLFEETGRRAGRERVIADVTRQVWSSGELERVMQTAVEQLGMQLDASKVVIRLGTEDQLLSE